MPNYAGNFVGGFADAFTRVAMGRKDQKDREKMAKLQGQLVELQIKNAQNQAQGQENLQDLMNPLTEFQQAPSTTSPGGREMTQFQTAPKRSLSEVLADPEGQLAWMQSGGDQNRLLPNSTKPPAVLEVANALGYQPGTPEFNEFVENNFGQKMDPMLELEMLKFKQQLAGGQFEFNQKQQEADLAAQERERGVRKAGFALQKDFKAAQEINQLQSELSNSLLSVGIPYGEFMSTAQSGGAALLDKLGFDVGAQRELLAKRDRLKKLMSVGVLNAVSAFKDLGTITDEKFEQIQKSVASLENQPGANALLIADSLEEAMMNAQIEGIPIEQYVNPDEVGAFVQTLREQAFAVQDSPDIVDVPAIADMSAEKLDTTMQGLAQMAREMKASGQEIPSHIIQAIDAAEKRWNELNGG